MFPESGEALGRVRKGGIKIHHSIDTKKEEVSPSSKEKIMEVKRTDRLQGEIDAPPSKSITQRAIAISSIDGESEIYNFLDSEDTRSAMEAWGTLGAKIEDKGDKLSIKGFNGKPKPQKKEINAGESGTVLRLILPIISLISEEVVVTGEGTLLERDEEGGRSNKMIVEALRELGVEVNPRNGGGEVPMKIRGEGEIKGGEIPVRGEMSSQVFSALLITLPLAKEDSKVIVKDEDRLVSRPYIDMTIEMLKKAGIRIEKHKKYKWFKVPGGQSFRGLGKFEVSGDYSSAAFLLAAGSLVESEIKITNLKKDGIQGDEKIIEVINQMGGDVKRKENSVEVKGPFDLKGIEINGRNIPDLVPVISALAAFADGETHISNIGHLQHKESNRLKAIKEEFSKLGIDVRKTESDLWIKGSEPESGVTLDPHEDHRIAMALSLIGLRTGDLKIKNPSCIDKSYPDFVKHMQKLGAEISID